MNVNATTAAKSVSAHWLSAVDHHRRKARFLSDIELVDALKQDKINGKVEQIAESITRLDLVIWDKLSYHRIVHGREVFSTDSDAQHLRGCYTDRGAAWSTYRTLAAKGFTGEAVWQSKAA